MTRASRPDSLSQASGSIPSLKTGTVLAFDFGERRIGVAVGEAGLGIAHPLETIDAAANDVRFARIATLIEKWQPVTLVVGLPLALDGTEHQLTDLARKFSQRLNGRFGLQVRLVDERLTSVEAQHAAREGGLDGREAKKHVDSLAAKLILETFFDENAIA